MGESNLDTLPKSFPNSYIINFIKVTTINSKPYSFLPESDQQEFGIVRWQTMMKKSSLSEYRFQIQWSGKLSSQIVLFIVLWFIIIIK